MEKILKHELYKHGSYLISLKESGSEFVNIDDEIQKLEELFQLASNKDHQPAFAVGEYVADEDFIYHILADRGETNRLVNSFELSTGLFHRNIVWTYKGLRKPKPATAEQIATFQRAEHFASKGREWSEFRKGDIVQNTKTMQLGLVESVDEDGDAWVNYNIDKPLIYPSCCKCTGALFLNLIQTAEELQEVGDESI